MQVQQELEHYRNDALYFERHRPELLARYSECWVAVYDQAVVGSARRLSELLKKLDRQGLPRAHVFVEHLSAKDDLLILFRA